jgi:glycosyltransferase involved in cell wall biosynthesis
MEVIHISPSYKPAYEYGGPTMSVSQLCEHLQKCPLKLQVLTTTANGQGELAVSTGIYYSVAGVPVRYFSRMTGDHSHLSPGLFFHLLKAVYRAKKDRKPCIIHVHSWWNLVAILSTLTGRVFSLPVVVSPRGMLTNYSFEHQKSLLKRMLHSSLGNWLLRGSHLHATSEQEKRSILAFVSPKSLVVLPNLVDLPVKQGERAKIPMLVSRHKQACTSSQAGPLKLLFFSRIDKKKGIELLLMAAASLQINYTLTLAGTGTKAYLEELHELANALGISKRIRWTGHVSNHDKYCMLMDHDLLVLPSYNENFANVVIESLSVGTAVLVSEEVGLADYIISSRLGWVCSLSTSDLAMQIEAISNQKEILADIRQDAPTRIYSDFHQQTLANTYMEFYKRLVVP